MILNVIVAGAKFVFGLATGSSAIQADGIHSFFDSFGNVVALVSIAMAARPADSGHPYGYAKFETYGSLIIGLMLLFAAFQVGSEAVTRLMEQRFTASVGPLSFVVMIATLCVNIFVASYEHRVGKRMGSEILKADARHTFSDVWVTLGVIVGLILVAVGIPAADPVMALLVTVAILISALEVFKAAFDTLSDKSRIPESAIVHRAESIDGVTNVHRVRTRGTESEVFCDLHIRVASDMSIRDAHACADKVEEALKAEFPSLREVLIHIEPQREPDCKVAFFDVGSTLIYPHPEESAVVIREAHELGIDLDPDEVCEKMKTADELFKRLSEEDSDAWASDKRITELWIHKYLTLLESLGIENQAQRLAYRIHRSYQNPDHWALYDDVLTCLNDLKSHGVRLAVVSNWDANLSHLLKGLGLSDYFETFVISSEVGYAKPREEIFREALDRMGVHSGDAVHIGDLPGADGASQKIGITTILIDRKDKYATSDLIRVKSLEDVGPLLRAWRRRPDSNRG